MYKKRIRGKLIVLLDSQKYRIYKGLSQNVWYLRVPLCLDDSTITYIFDSWTAAIKFVDSILKERKKG